MEQKQDQERNYVAERYSYKRNVVEIKEIIEIHRRAIRKLEKKIELSRPLTEQGTRICPSCNCTSMKYLGRTPQGGLTGGDDIYECEICHKNNHGFNRLLDDTVYGKS